MTSPIQPNKTYGVLHTESFFSFLGFAKKVGSDEIQKIDVFLDDKLIDTIEANEFIQKIDDMYDVESKAFKYNLPSEHIGTKAIISFKNHDSGEELLNSPYTLIDKNNEKFNEAKFLHSLSEPLSEELKNMYKPNSIGFLATKENLEDEEFVEDVRGVLPLCAVDEESPEGERRDRREHEDGEPGPGEQIGRDHRADVGDARIDDDDAHNTPLVLGSVSPSRLNACLKVLATTLKQASTM